MMYQFRVLPYELALAARVFTSFLRVLALTGFV